MKVTVKVKCVNGKIFKMDVSEQHEDGTYTCTILDNQGKKTDAVLTYNTEGDCLTEGKQELTVDEWMQPQGE